MRGNKNHTKSAISIIDAFKKRKSLLVTIVWTLYCPKIR